MRAIHVIPLLLVAGCVSLAPQSRSTESEAGLISGVPARKWADNSCGAGALSEVLNWLGDPVTEQRLSESLTKARHGGVVTVDLLLTARVRGFDAQLVRGDVPMVTRELQQQQPVILMLRVMDAPGRKDDLYHYVVLNGLDAKRDLVSMHYGDGHKRWVSLQPLERAWAAGGYATLIVRPRRKRVATDDDLKRAVLLEDSGQSSEAIVLYEQFLESHPESSVAWTNLGNARATRGEEQLAEAAYRNALFVDKDNADTLNNFAWMLLKQQRLDEAEPLARRAVQSEGDRYPALDTLGRILAAKGDCREARSIFDKALEAMPSDDLRSKTRDEYTTLCQVPTNEARSPAPMFSAAAIQAAAEAVMTAADDLAPQDVVTQRTRSAKEYWVVSAWLAAATIYDVESTFYFLRKCGEECREGNPLVRPFIERGRLATYGYSIALNGVVMYVARRMFDRDDPWWRVFPVSLAAVHGAAGSWNLHRARRE